VECISERGELLILNPHLINQVSIAPRGALHRTDSA
jgi:hypothetical protein